MHRNGLRGSGRQMASALGCPQALVFRRGPGRTEHGQTQSQSPWPEAATHVLITPTVLEASGSQAILRVGESRPQSGSESPHPEILSAVALSHGISNSDSPSSAASLGP